jgi:predicted nucleic acid-binding protein
MIVDASVILSAFFPDEDQPQAQALIRAHVMGRVALVAPTLLLYEVTNAVVQARRRGRISDEQAETILSSFEGLGIALRPVTWQQVLPLALRFDRSAYDAAYLALAEETAEPLITGDSRMFNAVREHLDRVQWLGDYSPAG